MVLAGLRVAPGIPLMPAAVMMEIQVRLGTQMEGKRTGCDVKGPRRVS